jgi:hypothetical protein
LEGHRALSPVASQELVEHLVMSVFVILDEAAPPRDAVMVADPFGAPGWDALLAEGLGS